MQNHIEEFVTAIKNHGGSVADISEIIADDTIRRAHDVADKPQKTSISYQLAVDADGFACGWFVCYKISPESVAWHSKAPRGSAQDYKARAKAWINSEEQRAKKEADRLARKEEAVRLTRDALEAGAPADGHGYLTSKQVEWSPLLQHEGAVLVPITTIDGELIGCQRIYKNGVKSFIPGSEKKGGFYLVATDDDDWSRVFIAEGLSTALTVRRVSGSPVFVAFDCGNLKPVAQAVRARHPRSVIIMAADDDQWTVDANGNKVNPGIRDASQAALAVEGLVWSPPDLEPPYTDWNDAAAVYGDEWVAEQLARVPMPVEEVETEEVVAPSVDWSPRERLIEMVRPLGANESGYYFLPKCRGQVLSFTATGLAQAPNLWTMGTPDEYRAILGDMEMKASDVARCISEILQAICHEADIYDSEKVYGAGAWNFDGKLYVNTGADVYAPGLGEVMNHSDVPVDGVMIREGRSYHLDAQPLTNKQAHELMKICTSLTWSKGINGTLLAGWLVVAPVGGALRWRPHIFITGQKGAGKSTVMERIVEPVLGRTCIRMDGGSTEAGLRKVIKNSSRPVIMDEFEAENKRDGENVGRILTWARKASSGGTITNANASYRAQSAICFAAINPAITQGADKDRITLLELKVNTGPDSERKYNELLDMIYETITPSFSNALLRRTIDHLDVLLDNCETFSKYAARILKSKRDGDQIGPMLAGAYLLHSTKRVSEEVAEAWCEKQDWTWAEERQEGSDSERLVRRILNSLIDYTTHDRTQKMPVSELISRARSGGVDVKDCRAALGRIGIRVEGDELWVSNSDDQLSKLLEGTPWVAYRNSMLRYPCAVASGKMARFGAGSPSRYLVLPLDGMLEDSDAAFEEVEF